MRKILLYPNEVLKTKCPKVTSFDASLHQLLDEMRQIMVDNKGMGLAANQVGELKRLFIMKDVRGSVWEFINPVLSVEDISGANVREGCLSTPGVLDIVNGRHEAVRVDAQDRNGDSFSVILYGIESVCAQHEIDHLDGIFWIDRMPSRQSKRAALKSWDKIRAKLGL